MLIVNGFLPFGVARRLPGEASACQAIASVILDHPQPHSSSRAPFSKENHGLNLVNIGYTMNAGRAWKAGMDWRIRVSISRAPLTTFALGALLLLVACAGDDDVSPLPVDAGADSASASKDATPESAGPTSDGASEDAPAETATDSADAPGDADAEAPTSFAEAEDARPSRATGRRDRGRRREIHARSSAGRTTRRYPPKRQRHKASDGNRCRIRLVAISAIAASTTRSDDSLAPRPVCRARPMCTRSHSCVEDFNSLMGKLRIHLDPITPGKPPCRTKVRFESRSVESYAGIQCAGPIRLRYSK